MKGVIVFLVVCVLSLVVALPVCPPPPSEGGAPTLPNPDDCSTFYTCYNELPVLMDCFPGLWFNPLIGVCDFPVNVDGSNCIPPTTTAEPTTAEPTTEEETTVEELTSSAI